MRLTKEQISHFHTVLDRFLEADKYQLYLFGSRVMDQFKGGDIDLVVLTDSRGKKIFQESHLDILVEFKKSPLVGQRRIDIKAATSEDFKTDPFLKSIQSEMILI